MATKRTRSSTPARKGTQDCPPKIPQPHGGALYAGGVPGHDGSRAGQRKSEVRQALLNGAAAAVPLLTAQLALAETEPQLAQGAADKLLKYGVGVQREVEISRDDVRSRLADSLAIIRREAPKDVADAIVRELHTVWTR